MFIFQNFVRISAIFILAFLSTFQLVASVPIDAHELIVFNPTISVPTAAAAWARGSKQTVRWGQYTYCVGISAIRWPLILFILFF